jgi:PadR family transcriptional regulator
MQSMSKPAAYLGELEHLILLAILQAGDEAYTVPIREVLLARSGRRVTRGAIYTSLERLETKGLVNSRVGEPLAIRGGRARRYFQVTPAGLEAMRAAREAVRTLSEGLESLLERRS